MDATSKLTRVMRRLADRLHDQGRDTNVALDMNIAGRHIHRHYHWDQSTRRGERQEPSPDKEQPPNSEGL